MLADEHLIGEGRPYRGGRECDAECRQMRAQGVVGADCCCDAFGILWLRAGVGVLAPVAVRPAVEAALAYRCQVVLDKVGPLSENTKRAYASSLRAFFA